ncbi:cytochrome b N-terminal domain-containing protein [Candidatus Woesearchaeota archaeon]|nr:cytochrome b N-terminal domain-containing protein [Candidatus Woesearchaeota archaeon]
MATLGEKFFAWFDERFNLKEDLRKILKKPVPPYATHPMYCLGGISFLCYLVLVVTGILLARYYIPTPEEAYSSVKFIMQEVTFGSLFRSIHHWAANMMIAAVVLHMFRVYLTGAFKKPRELNWIAGVALLLTTLIFGFSGYLLPWDQLSYWATTVGLQIPASIPVLGPAILKIFIGGAEVGAETLARFYFLHVFLLPMIVFMLLGMHFFMVRRQGISEPL